MSLKPNHIEFQNEIKQRKIECLIHFTPTINLFSILENNKLMSRANLESLDIEQFDILDYVQFTDDVRYDDKNYINLSLSGPNTFLFSRFRKKTKDDLTINWCIIKIDPKHIYDNETLFSITNAASSAAKKQYGISGDLDKFKMLFTKQLNINTYNGVRTISRNSAHSKYPTDVQAEILVKNKISSDSILAVCFESEEEMAEAKAAMSSFDTSNFIVDKEIFLPNRSI
ncbi:DarT ssDNA thymidine ADP-ribosyltransferase family protein [Dokdonia sp.]|uniref:DarT ssDNA thymidine ADP-ribosyltransferase family protein n=1 Tax=Dokdonia sp. TaxID=2024995 RepID=UPI0032669D15